MTGHLDRGRESFERGAWAEAFAELGAADRGSRLPVEDVERLAAAAYLIGKVDEGVAGWERAHHAFAGSGDVRRAVRCAFWLAFVLLNHGELARGAGWVSRGQRMLDGAHLDCVERGYLLYATALRSVLEGDVPGAGHVFSAAALTGERFGAPELVALARVGHGRCLIREGDTAGGMTLLDEAMATISGGELSATAVGDLYCTGIEGCQEVFDVRRAQEWTAALSRWCDSQPELVRYHGQCLVHRAELMVLSGRWQEATVEARRACARLARPRGQPALGAAYYVRADLHRLRGQYSDAEEAYRQAGRRGRDPQPGLALLRLAQGRSGEACAALRRCLDEAAADALARSRLLSAFVEATVASGDTNAAGLAAQELSTIATGWRSPYLSAQAAYATGLVLLVDDEATRALPRLRLAHAGWVELEVPHEAARTRLLIARACGAVGDAESEALELSAARAELAALGAGTESARLEEPAGPRRHDGLTDRELEVLRHLATGMSNRAVAAELVISDRTVATHVSSILHKLHLPSRAAATAYAHQRHLV